MTYDHWENPLVLALREARRQRRSDFQARYGSFWKCPECGAYVLPGDSIVYRAEHRHYDSYGLFINYLSKLVGYTPPPERP